VAIGQTKSILYGSDCIIEEIDGKKFKISSDSFFQTNSHQLSTLISVVKDFMRSHECKHLLDLYSGVGTFAIAFSDMFREITAVEILPQAVSMAEKNIGINSVRNCRLICGDAYGVVRSILNERLGIDAIIVDPPRNGIPKKVISKIVEMKPEILVYVSCNPSTLARDLKIFVENGFIVESVQPIDLFPHTYHIESVAKLTKK
jgi:23S rRNA (uracil-5-)-methyltransferase RumA